MCQNVSKCVRMCQNVTNYVLEWMGLDFYYYDGLQPEMRAGIINEHECSYYHSLCNSLQLKVELK